jgi:hypothetical protein
MRTSTSLALLAAATLASACGEDSSAPQTKKITVLAGPVEAVQEDTGPSGPSPGETRSFTAELEDESGRPMGRMDGSVVLTDRVRRGGEVREHRVGDVQYTLRDGSLLLGGVYVSTPRSGVPAREGVRRPVVGGTGAYKGAMGEVTQTPLPDDRQKAVFEITVPKR